MGAQEATTILAQIEVLRQELIRARSAIDKAGTNRKLHGRVAARFDKELTRLETRNSALKAKVTKGELLDACWRDLREITRNAGAVFDECLALIQGMKAREASLDEGICALTDDLLDDLAAWSDVSWGRFTLLATSEFYRDKAELIRIRYPEVSLWAMPLAAHEFGHYLGPELRQSEDGGYVYPFQALLRASDEARSTSVGTLPHTKEWFHLQEHFADLFATYTLGPAYAAAFILLRLNPAEAQENTLTHPPGTWRVRGIFWTLDKMDELQSATLQWSSFRNVTKRLREIWYEGLQQVGQPETLPSVDESLVIDRMKKLFDLLASATPKQLPFGPADWLRSEGMAARIGADLDVSTLPDQLSRRDVLNAAWLARLQATDQSPYALNDIAMRALAAYRRIPCGVNCSIS